MKKFIPFATMAALAVSLFTARAEEAKDGWKSLFNGKDLTGWKVNEENPSAFSVSDGAIHIKGGRSQWREVQELRVQSQGHDEEKRQQRYLLRH